MLRIGFEDSRAGLEKALLRVVFPLKESGVSQIFLAMDARKLGDEGSAEAAADAVIASLHCAEPVDAGRPVRYPGEHTLVTREENLRLGLPVYEEIWGGWWRGSIEG